MLTFYILEYLSFLLILNSVFVYCKINKSYDCVYFFRMIFKTFNSQDFSELRLVMHCQYLLIK